jgi:hypothetical protein
LEGLDVGFGVDGGFTIVGVGDVASLPPLLLEASVELPLPKDDASVDASVDASTDGFVEV